ncbi:MAG TPA: PIG-L deacetylase family protein [Ramlibacter sp.]|nr:PIG-L deacetylase family protein [Ramlibacter sp.]
MWRFIRRLSRQPAQANQLPPQLDLSAARRVLVIAPHPDDETLGCGGTLARLAPVCEVHVLLVTNGDGGGGLPPGTSDARKKEMADAARTLGIATPVLHLDEPDGRFADSRSYRSALADIVGKLEPNWVFLPWLDDTHADHARIACASSHALRRSGVESLLYYETWTPVPATHVVDITPTLETKKAAVLCHETALKYGSYMDAMLGLNAYRALYLPAAAGQRWAEAFAVTSARNNRFV